ncbi:hypothetical protein KCU96_g19, partial [Aureobasidium melanogenum]
LTLGRLTGWPPQREFPTQNVVLRRRKTVYMTLDHGRRKRIMWKIYLSSLELERMVYGQRRCSFALDRGGNLDRE